MTDDRMNILGIPFDVVTTIEVLAWMELACHRHSKVMCVTPNPEICLTAGKNKQFLKVLNDADMSIPDGFGILWAARYLDGERGFFPWFWTLLTPWRTKKKGVFPERVTGTDVMKRFCQQSKCKIFLLGASPEVNARLAKKLRSAGTKVVGNYSGDPSVVNEEIIRKMIDDSGAEVLFVAFGAPNQELWIARNLPKLSTVCVAMGIGGAFDFLVGKRKRAPQWMRNFGLEWLYRLCIEPRRIMRIFNATVVFPWKVLRER